MLWLSNQDPIMFDQEFRARYRRPPPWIEVVAADDIENLVWQLSGRVGLNPRTINLAKLLDAAWESMPGRLESHRGEYRGCTEPLARAVRRLDVPCDGVVLVWHAIASASVFRLRMKDLVEFGELLWTDGMWVFDEQGAWILVGEHDWPAYFWRFDHGRN